MTEPERNERLREIESLRDKLREGDLIPVQYEIWANAIDDVISQLRSRDAELARLRALVKEAKRNINESSAQFAFYAQEHMRKGSTDKATVNQGFADRADAVAAKIAKEIGDD